ncbi:uncharacterized protein EV422DRAFT_545881 [Fimicolochytrium jonesii]|uniref:uncharacterized protein n=1 Tax=Fimicolochytrium jonesii TaxID=1396493 RepID=UPI0022FDEBC7|nr:uncharacterized protein EV422DRAFT_545881 [Fimicolochytrium jonesii]KAI8816396.1 hypothetical protein EV422DRAFT_545881 [Fimicolochytrium jonesii]
MSRQRDRSRLRYRSESRSLLRTASTASFGDDLENRTPRAASIDRAGTHRSITNIHSHNLSHAHPHNAQPAQQKRKRAKPKQRDEFHEIYGSDADRDEEGRWAESAFKKLKEKAEVETITTYVLRKGKEPAVLPGLIDRLLFHPDYVSPSAGVSPGAQAGARNRGQRTPAFLADAGLYVPDPPPVSLRNMQRMEKRILCCEPDSAAQWFTPTQTLAISPIPLSTVPRRPFRDPIPILNQWSQGIKTHPVDIETPSSSSDIDTPDLLILRTPLTKPSTYTPITHTPSGTYLLVLDLCAIEFRDHPLMTEEMALARSVENGVRELNGRRKRGVVETLSRQLGAAREAWREWVVAHPEYDNTAAADGNENHPRSKGRKQMLKVQRDLHARRVLLEKVRAVRLLRDAETQTEREVEFRVLREWQRLGEVRAKQGFVGSAVMVGVKAVEGDAVQDIARLRTELTNDVEEFIDLLNLEAHILSQKAATASITDATSPLKRRGSTHEHVKDITDDAAAAARKAIPSKIRRYEAEATKRLESSHRPPGAPIFRFKLYRTASITPLAECPLYEQTRRTAAPPQLYLRLLYNKKMITQTAPQPLDSLSGQFHFGGSAQSKAVAGTQAAEKMVETQVHRLCLRVSEMPETIEAEILEKTNFGEILCAIVPIPIPLSTETTQALDRTPHSLDFSGHFSSDERWTSGVLKLGCAWGADYRGHVQGPGGYLTSTRSITSDWSTFSIGRLMHPTAGLDLWKLLEWTQGLVVDPNNPANFEVFRLQRLLGAAAAAGSGATGDVLGGYAARKYCRLAIPGWMRMAAFSVARDEDFTTKRLTLLQKRALIRPESDESSQSLIAIPLFDHEITDTLLDEFSPKDDPLRLSTSTPTPAPTTLSHRSSAMSLLSPAADPPPLTSVEQPFLRRLRRHHLLRSSYKPRAKGHDDYIREVKMPPRPQTTFFMMDWLRPHRPLRPARDAVKRERVEAVPEGGCRILVHVRINVLQQDKAPLIDPSSRITQVVRPYVRIGFQDSQARTSTEEGPNPQWNDTLTVDVTFGSGGLRGASALDVEAEDLRIDVFDEVVVDMTEAEQSANLTYERKGRAWLGSLRIPFATLRSQTRIAGEFPLHVSPALIAYEYPTTTTSRTPSNPISFLHLFITLDPLLAPLPQAPLDFQSLEDPATLRRTSSFMRSLPRHARPRMASTPLSVNTVSGHTALITRFIRPQKPPAGFEAVTPGALLRFVSLIPRVDATLMYAHPMWATSDQMLSVGAGGPAEHAVLLCNYFGWCFGEVVAFLVLGRDVVGNSAAWVLTRGGGAGAERVVLWDPVEGMTWKVDDTRCVLKEIALVFDRTNVWANVQTYSDPPRMRFDLMISADWRPLFAAGTSDVGFTTFQSEAPLYKAIDTNRASEIQLRIERSLIDGIENWRGTTVTRWNRLASRTLATALPLLEHHLLSLPLSPTLPSSTTIPPSPLATLPDLTRLLNIYRLRGSPLWFRYTDTATIVDFIRGMEVHVCEDDGAEFACAVWCGAYEAGVVGVWVWVGCLFRGR